MSLGGPFENSISGTGWPLASAASAARRRVSPATTESAAGVTATALTSWATVTAALPDAEPAVAVIVAVPFADRRHQPGRCSPSPLKRRRSPRSPCDSRHRLAVLVAGPPRSELHRRAQVPPARAVAGLDRDGRRAAEDWGAGSVVP